KPNAAAEHRWLGLQYADAAAASRDGIECDEPENNSGRSLRGRAGALLPSVLPVLSGALLLSPPSLPLLASLVTPLRPTRLARGPHACGTHHAGASVDIPQLPWR